LTEEEKMRNNFGYDYLFVGKRHILFKLLLNIYEKGKQNSVERWIPIDFCPGKLLAGKVAFSLQRQEAPSESIPVSLSKKC
jgi:5'-3' exonuclease